MVCGKQCPDVFFQSGWLVVVIDVQLQFFYHLIVFIGILLYTLHLCDVRSDFIYSGLSFIFHKDQVGQFAQNGSMQSLLIDRNQSRRSHFKVSVCVSKTISWSSQTNIRNKSVFAHQWHREVLLPSGRPQLMSMCHPHLLPDVRTQQSLRLSTNYWQTSFSWPIYHNFVYLILVCVRFRPPVSKTWKRDLKETWKPTKHPKTLKKDLKALNLKY
jgi:hypothetical protein